MKHHLHLLLAAGFGAISIGAAAAVHDWTATRFADGEFANFRLVDMNNAAQITGLYASKSDVGQHSFLYSPAGASQVVDIGSLGGSRGTEVVALNSSGQLTGFSWTPDGRQLPFVYRNGRMEPLVPPGFGAGGTGTGGSGGSGTGINNRGEVLINWITVDHVRHGTVVNPAGLFTDLNAPGRQVIPKGINNRGQIFGGLATPASGDGLTSLHGFLYDNGQITDFGTLGGSYTQVSDMNESGQIVGSSYGATDFVDRPFLYSDGRMMELAGFPFGGGVADINDRGQIIGNIQMESPIGGNVHGFLYSDGRIIDLGANFPVAINDRGQIVGYTNRGDEFFYSDGKMTNLTEWLRTHFSDVASTSSDILLNDLGQIAILANDPFIHSMVFVLTPIPEPSTYALILSGLGVLAWIARRQRGRSTGNRAGQTPQTGSAA